MADVRANVAEQPQWVVDLATTFVSVAGLLVFVGAVVLTYTVAVESARLLVHAPRSLAPDFVLPLVPIAFAYLVAHYFSLFVIQGQFIYSLDLGPVRPWLGPLRDRRLRTQSRGRLTGDGVVRPGRGARRRARGGARDRPRSRGRALREPEGRSTLPVPDARIDGPLHRGRVVASLAGVEVVAHGGLVGAIVEALLFLTVASILIAVWLRERRGGRDHVHDGPARLTDDE